MSHENRFQMIVWCFKDMINNRCVIARSLRLSDQATISLSLSLNFCMWFNSPAREHVVLVAVFFSFLFFEFSTGMNGKTHTTTTTTTQKYFDNSGSVCVSPKWQISSKRRKKTITTTPQWNEKQCIYKQRIGPKAKVFVFQFV